ncbi:MAG TPA: FHA domain-containing protein [Thermoanaerobaculia bacterium]|nr:FHA domain-containing protein [Thermoanaerobaculia bacterium]
MSFLVQRDAGRGLTLTQISAEVLRIGRGTNQELRSENPAVALEHAVIEQDAAGYAIRDRGSITGTYVNGKPVESARLSKGDRIEIGDLRIDVQLADPSKPLFLRVSSARSVAGVVFDEAENASDDLAAAPGAEVLRPVKVDYAAAYRLRRTYLSKLSITAMLLIVAFAVIGEAVRPEGQHMFRPGEISSAHGRARDAQGRSIADRCDACHVPWRSVTDAKCRQCHEEGPHALLVSTNLSCFSCHAEHRGATKLSAMGDRECTGCHQDLHAVVNRPPSQLASLRFGDGRYSFQEIARIDTFGGMHPQFVYPSDANTLRFNHARHLVPQGIPNASGRREVLRCDGCHEMETVSGSTDPVAINFAAHCQSCHRLSFDPRLPSAEVPHGAEPGVVYGFIAAAYSGDRDLTGRPASEVRRILSERKSVRTDARSVLAAEQVVKTKCRLCHEIVERDGRLAVVPPHIRREWLTAAAFTHERHLTIACETCHQSVRTSSNTSDVLMPQREQCAGCHGRNVAREQTASSCLTCHEYHGATHGGGSEE